MARDQREPDAAAAPCRSLVVGNYCHDVLMRDGVVLAETLGGATSFICTVLDGLSIPSHCIAKVGSDFAYPVSHSPVAVPSSATTLFHAHFFSELQSDAHGDRVLKRVRACDPISPSDLPESRFAFGMAVGVGGEISPETLERMLDICDVVLVDIQSLIREFDPSDGTVKLVNLKESGFFHLLPRVGFLKASEEEAPFLDVEEARKCCCVIVTNGEDGCTVYWQGEEWRISPFPTVQVDPTGAGDSFLGGFVSGLVEALAVPDAALLGNLFGSLTVSQIGLPKFDSGILQRVKDEVQRRKMQYIGCNERRKNSDMNFTKPVGHKQFHASLSTARLISASLTEDCQWDLQDSTPKAVEESMHPQCSGQQRLSINTVYEEPIQSVDGRP
ncbi:inositol 3-kinase [Malania oleifera]|uniref:inositol 3-kinase n=1 Tax=Malania oleifera TaxID=397392 RepID=UPI0025ADFAC5|nr:inositol 3-kinase [Malania oleifera]